MSDHRKKRDFFPKKEVKLQLEELQARGQPLHYEKDVPLAPQDITFVRRLFLKVAIFCLVLSIPILCSLYFFQDEEMVMWICLAASLFIVYLIGRAALQVRTILKAGKKTIVRGIITDRFTKKEYGEADEDGKRPETTVRYLRIGTKEFRVDNVIYASHKTGEAIELDYIVNFGGKPYFLRHQKLQSAGLRLR